MRITWRTVAVLSALVMMGLLISLITIATSVGADSLATTALALAVIAFGAQLIVYVAQVADSSETRRQALEVNAATQASLARIGTTVANSDQLLRDQYGEVVKELTGNLRRASIQGKESDSPLDFGDAVGILKSQVSGAPSANRTASARFTEVDDMEDDDLWDLSELEAWPGYEEMDEAAEAHRTLRTLDPLSVGQIIRFASDEKISYQLDVLPGMVYFGQEDSPFTEALLSAGLVERTGRHPRGRPPKNGQRPEYLGLTDKGRMAARLLIPAGTAPAHVKTLMLDPTP